MAKRSFAADLGRRSHVKKDNDPAAFPAKLGLREAALEEVGGAVLDCFAGRGAIWQRVWRRAEGYVGVEKELEKVLRHPAPVHHTESLIALRALDLSRFRIFDLDAYGGPWAEVAVIAARRRLAPGERLAIVITDGSVRRAMLGRVTRELAALAGVPASGMGAHRRWTDLARRALEAAAEQMGGRLASLRESDLAHHSLGMWHGLAVIEAASGPA